MVVLTLTPSRGNGARSFPATGYLGLSDVTLAGVVRTKIEEDRKPIEASSLVVRIRCYESLGASSGSGLQTASTSNYGASTSTQSVTDASKGQSNGKGRVLYEKSVTIWTAEQCRARAAAESSCSEGDSPRHNYPPRSRGPQYANLGDLQQPWRLVIPPEAVLEGAKSTMIFKTWRIWWAIEAVISHRPSGIHGDRMVKSHQVALINHAAASTSLTPLQWSSITRPSSPAVEYQMNGPSLAFGASDPFLLSILLRRAAKSEVPKRVSVELRREIVYAQDNTSAMSQSMTSSGGASGTRRRSVDGKRQEREQSSYVVGALRPAIDYSPMQAPLPSSGTHPSYKNLTPPQSIPTPIEYDETHVNSYFSMMQAPLYSQTTPAVTVTSPPASLQYAAVKDKKEDVSLVTFEADVAFNSEGTWSGQVRGSMPRAKSLYHYALGESCTTGAASSRFYLVVRIHFRQRNSFLELPHRTISFTTVSDEEREKAVQQLPRIHAIQIAEAKLLGLQETSDERMSEDEREGVEEEERHVRLSTVRRRSEQPESLDSPRTRIRYGSVPPLSPGVSASDLPPVGSPALSGASTVTQRPRTSTSRRHGASLPPHRNTRPRSSGGLSSSSASLRSTRSANLLSHASLAGDASPYPPPAGGLTHSRSSPQLGSGGEAVTTGLFANFAGFTLRPPDDIITSPSLVEQELPPKPGVARSRSLQKDDSVFTYQPPVLLNYSAPSFSEDDAPSTSSGSGSPSPPHSHQSSMLRTASTASVLEPITNNSLGIRRKSGLAAGFSFFRRGTKV